MQLPSSDVQQSNSHNINKTDTINHYDEFFGLSHQSLTQLVIMAVV